jgi:hypothetical protein
MAQRTERVLRGIKTFYRWVKFTIRPFNPFVAESAFINIAQAKDSAGCSLRIIFPIDI